MWIRPRNDESNPKTLGEFIPISSWVELYGMHQWRAHVFCPPEALTQIGQAAERVFRRRFGLEFLPQAREYQQN